MNDHDINHELTKEELELLVKQLEDEIVNESLEIIENEINKKDDEIDFTMIDECVENIIEIDKVERLSDEEIKNRVNSIINKQSSKHKYSYKWLRVVVCAVILLLSFQLTAMAFGTNPIVEMYNFFISNTGITTVTKDGITFTYLDNIKTYNSIEKLIEQENLDIIYPSKLPQKIKLEDIIKYDIDGYTKYYLTFNENNLIWQINEKHNTSIDKLDSYKKVIINNLEYYILNENTTCEIIFYHNNYEYQIIYTNYDKLLDILENLKIGDN